MHKKRKVMRKDTNLTPTTEDKHVAAVSFRTHQHSAVSQWQKGK